MADGASPADGGAVKMADDEAVAFRDLLERDEEGDDTSEADRAFNSLRAFPRAERKWAGDTDAAFWAVFSTRSLL